SPPKTATTVEAVLPLIGKADVDRGRSLYLSRGGAACSTCHRMEGFGNVFAPDLSDIGSRADAVII
ncbi:MAG: c-type cytochrome, partial [Akkermansiaceae bacterium]|nr:c-type cytochrome [Akkermansiaceae bacterium]